MSMGRFSAPHCHPSRNLFILPPPAIDRRYLCRSPPGNFEIKHFWMIFVKVPEVLVLVKWFAFENPPELPLALRHVAKVRVRGRRMGTPVCPVGIFALFRTMVAVNMTHLSRTGAFAGGRSAGTEKKGRWRSLRRSTQMCGTTGLSSAGGRQST